MPLATYRFLQGLAQGFRSTKRVERMRSYTVQYSDTVNEKWMKKLMRSLNSVSLVHLLMNH